MQLLFGIKLIELTVFPPEDRQPIKIFINSDGGDLPATLSIIDLIQMSETPVWTINIGKAYSGGFFVCIAGSQKIRLILHQLIYSMKVVDKMAATHINIFKVPTFYKKELELLKKIVLKHTNISEEEYQEIKKDDLWLLADEALKKKCYRRNYRSNYIRRK